jgi:hypothetical protein
VLTRRAFVTAGVCASGDPSTDLGPEDLPDALQGIDRLTNDRVVVI